MKTKGLRFHEIDALRGFAICLMLISNFLTDLDFFGITSFPPNFWLARITAFLFIFVAGISLHLSHEKALLKKKQSLFTKFLKRGSLIFALGILITLFTFAFMREGFVVFGILHFLGLSIVLGYLFLKLSPMQNLIAAFIILLAGIFLQNLSFDFPWLLWLGFAPKGFFTVDYFPFLPWLSFFLLGISFGKVFYAKYKRNFAMPFSNAPALAFIGRNSLLIYLLHQLLLISLLYLLFPPQVSSQIRLGF